jgi:hypothetical protein
MKEALGTLEQRRQLLVLRSRLLRAQVGLDALTIGTRLDRVDRGVGMLRSAVRSPWIAAGASALALAIGPVRAVRWAGRGLLALSLLRRITALVQRPL